MNAPPDYSLAWDDYRRRIRWFFGVWLGGFAILVLMVKLFLKLGLGDWPFLVIGPAWMIAFVVVALWSSRFKCPRCRKPFFFGYWYHNPFARKCVHCGL